MYFIFSIILLFTIVLVFGFTYKREFRIEESKGLLKVTKKKTRITKFLLILALVFNVLVALITKDGLNWSVILIVPFAAILIWMTKKSIQQHKSMLPFVLDLNSKTVAIGKEIIDTEKLTQLEYCSIYTGSNNRNHALSLVTDKSKKLIIQSRYKREVMELNKLLHEKLDLQTLKVTQRGLIESKKEQVNYIK